MTWFTPLSIWLATAICVIAIFAITARRADHLAKHVKSIGVHNLPAPANDNAEHARQRRLLRGAAAILTPGLLFAHTDPGSAQTIALPPLHVTAPASSSCVDVQVEGAHVWHCRQHQPHLHGG